jgi:hypothetical protein
LKLRESMLKIYGVLVNDETLLRLLYYKPSNFNDDPLDPSKPDVTSLPNRWDITKDRIKKSIVTHDLDTSDPKCRILMYPDKRRPHNNSYAYSDQYVNLDILCHHEYDEVDFRMSWICDRINDLMFNKRIAGIGKIEYYSGGAIGVHKDGYVGFRLIYKFSEFSE